MNDLLGAAVWKALSSERTYRALKIIADGTRNSGADTALTTRQIAERLGLPTDTPTQLQASRQFVLDGLDRIHELGIAISPPPPQGNRERRFALGTVGDELLNLVEYTVANMWPASAREVLPRICLILSDEFRVLLLQIIAEHMPPVSTKSVVAEVERRGGTFADSNAKHKANRVLDQLRMLADWHLVDYSDYRKPETWSLSPYLGPEIFDNVRFHDLPNALAVVYSMLPSSGWGPILAFFGEASAHRVMSMIPPAPGLTVANADTMSIAPEFNGGSTGMSAKGICEATGMDHANVSDILKHAEALGLAESLREGQYRRYRRTIDYDALINCLQPLSEHVAVQLIERRERDLINVLANSNCLGLVRILGVNARAAFTRDGRRHQQDSCTYSQLLAGSGLEMSAFSKAFLSIRRIGLAWEGRGTRDRTPITIAHGTASLTAKSAAIELAFLGGAPSNEVH